MRRDLVSVILWLGVLAGCPAARRDRWLMWGIDDCAAICSA